MIGTHNRGNEVETTFAPLISLRKSKYHKSTVILPKSGFHTLNKILFPNASRNRGLNLRTNRIKSSRKNSVEHVFLEQRKLYTLSETFCRCCRKGKLSKLWQLASWRPTYAVQYTEDIKSDKCVSFLRIMNLEILNSHLPKLVEQQQFLGRGGNADNESCKVFTRLLYECERPIASHWMSILTTWKVNRALFLIFNYTKPYNVKRR